MEACGHGVDVSGHLLIGSDLSVSVAICMRAWKGVIPASAYKQGIGNVLNFAQPVIILRVSLRAVSTSEPMQLGVHSRNWIKI